MQVELVRATLEPKKAMATAGSNCYDSVASERIVDHCYKSGHHSVLEFADFHFKVSEVSRALTHQLVRHRAGFSYAQRSQRYCSEDEFKTVMPSSIKGNHRANILYSQAMRVISECYNDLQLIGIPNEDARYILPNAVHSVIDVKMNFRALVNFCNLRLCTRSQWEIRELASKMKSVVEQEYPKLSHMLAPKCEAHSPYVFCTEGESCGKHPHISKVIKRGVK